MDTSIKEQLKALKNISGETAPDASWVLRNREAMLSTIRSDAREKQQQTMPLIHFVSQFLHIFISRRAVQYLRPAMIYSLILGIILGSWGVGVASAGSVPGDLLYSVKRASEGIELAFTSKEKKVTKRLEIASRRVEEKKRVIDTVKKKQKKTVAKESENASPKDIEVIAALDKDIQEQIALAGKTLEEQLLTDETTVTDKVDAVVEFKEKVDELETDLKIVKEKISDVVLETEKEETVEDNMAAETISKAHDELENSLEQIELDALGQVVEVAKEAQSDSEISAEEKQEVVDDVVELVTEKVTDITKDVEDVIDEVTQAKEIAVEVTTEDIDLDPVTPSSPVDTSTTSQQIVEDVIKEVDEKVIEVQETFDQISEEVKKDIKEDNLDGALEKVKQLQTTNDQTKEIVTQATEELKKITQDVLDSNKDEEEDRGAAVETVVPDAATSSSSDPVAAEVVPADERQ